MQFCSMFLFVYESRFTRMYNFVLAEHNVNNCKSREGMYAMYPIIRLERIELNHFKNVKQGTIESAEYRNKLFYTHKADVIGIYGQNGSGKTAVVEALNLLKLLMSGESLPIQTKNYINQESWEAALKFVFYVEMKQAEQELPTRYLIYYDVGFSLEEGEKPREQKSMYIKDEVVSYSTIGVRGKTELLHYDAKDGILPKVRYQELGRQNSEAMIACEVAKRISIKERRSFLFQTEIMELFETEQMNPEYARIIKTLHYYAKMNLFVVANRDVGNCQITYMPISFRLTMEDVVTSGVAPISLTGPTVISNSSYELVRLVVQQLNLVVASILPDMRIEVQDLGKELNASSEEVHRVELVSVRNGVKVPLAYESEGIKKILSILSTLISVYNNPSICLIVDELDSGVFEYLLGELLQIIERNARGQLIFTSHNLRALEKLHRDSIVISTANPTQRYVRIPHERGYNNLRNTYLRSIDLGGLEEEIYHSRNSYEISYAFRKAGDLFEGE